MIIIKSNNILVKKLTYGYVICCLALLCFAGCDAIKPELKRTAGIDMMKDTLSFASDTAHIPDRYCDDKGKEKIKLEKILGVKSDVVIRYAIVSAAVAVGGYVIIWRCWEWIKDEKCVNAWVNFLGGHCRNYMSIDDEEKEICVRCVNILLESVAYAENISMKQKDMILKRLLNHFSFLSGKIIFREKKY